ncbi:hypothetical protein G6M24_04220 [Agrobacterium tumefaciens]|nr:hypothetical protein [Agrobacterium tumefaciens]
MPDFKCLESPKDANQNKTHHMNDLSLSSKQITDYPVDASGKFDVANFIQKHRLTLKLKKKDMAWLHALSKIENVLNSQESIDFHITKVYLECLRAVEKRLNTHDSSIEKKIKILRKLELKLNKDLSLEYHFHQKHYVGFYIEKYVYRHIYTKAECLIRKIWGIRIRTNPEYFSPIEEFQSAFHLHLGVLIQQEISALVSFVGKPDHKIEVLLNNLYTGRWKDQLKQLSAQCASDRDYGRFSESIYQLAFANNEKSKIQIFFDGAKMMMPYSRYEALGLYLHYFHHATDFFKPKPLNEAMRKRLAFTVEQERSFDRIIANLDCSGVLEVALEALAEFRECQ